VPPEQLHLGIRGFEDSKIEGEADSGGSVLISGRRIAQTISWMEKVGKELWFVLA
jgi:hypothetical protein